MQTRSKNLKTLFDKLRIFMDLKLGILNFQNNLDKKLSREGIARKDIVHS